MDGIWIKKDVKIVNPQELWDLGYRNIYTDITGNSLLRDTANVCAYYGFKLGLYHRLRYPPETGSADSQAQEFAIAESALMNTPGYKDVKFLPPVLHVAKGIPPFCETAFYRGMVMTFWQKYLSYHGESEHFLMKITTNLISWMKPTQLIIDTYGLFYHEPSATLSYAPWPRYVYRSYVARSIAANMAEPVEPWVPVPPPVVPPVVLTPEQKLVAIRKILDS